MGRLKITDFGIVKLAGERSLTRTGFNPGTVEYMSPEQIRGLEVDARSDLYSLGVAFYEALTGRLPFPHSDTGSEYEVLRGHIELAPPPLATLKPDVPEALSALVMRSLEKDPDARFQTAAEFLNALLDYEQNSARTREEVMRGTAKQQKQITHSMTEMISHDTRQEPITAPVATPRPAQPSIPSQVIEPAPIAHHAATPSVQQPRRYGLLIAGVFIALLVVAGTAFLFLKQSGGLSSAATNISAPTPAITPTPTATPEDARLKQAREAEAEERYKDAIMIYGEYLAKHALDTDPGVKEIQTHSTKLNKFFGLINMGEFLMNMKDYGEAERNYADALKLRPDSKLAQTGLEKAKSRQAKRN
jgi:serine/threonine protein kinase